MISKFQTKGDGKSIYERIKELEYKESELLKEAHELREQNDLLEFRIVELEESHDKVRNCKMEIYNTDSAVAWWLKLLLNVGISRRVSFGLAKKPQPLLGTDLKHLHSLKLFGAENRLIS